MDPGKIDWRFSRRNQARPDRIYSPIAYERKPQLQGKSIFYRKREVTKMFEDKTLVCKECGKEFVFTAGEQEFYAERGFQNEPQRCKACRDARKNATRGPREYYTATCAACGGKDPHLDQVRIFFCISYVVRSHIRRSVPPSAPCAC